MGMITGLRFHLPSLPRGRAGSIMVALGVMIAGASVTAARYWIGPQMAQYEPLPWLSWLYFALPFWVYPVPAAVLFVGVLWKDRIVRDITKQYAINLAVLGLLVLVLALMVVAITWTVIASAERVVG